MNNIYEMLIRRSRQIDESDSSSSGSDSSSSGGGGVIPTDTLLYMPFTEDLLDHSTYTRSFTTPGTTPTLKTVDGIPCAEFPLNTYMRTTDNTGITLGTGDRTMSTWFRSLSSTPSNQYNFVLALGSGTTRTQTSLGADSEYGTMQYGGGIWGGSAWTIVENTPVDTSWHHLLWMIKNNHTYFYFDGALARYNEDTLTLKSDTNITIRNTSNNFSYPFGAVCQYSAIRIYDRALTSDEILALANENFSDQSESGSESWSDSSSSESYSESQSDSSSSSSESYSTSDSSSSGGVTPVMPTDYVRRYKLTSNLTDEKHSSNTDYNLTAGSSATTSYGTTDGISRILVHYGCLFTTYNAGLGITNGGAVSTWCKLSSVPETSVNFKCFVNESSSATNPFAIGYKNGVYSMAYKESNVVYVDSSKSLDTSWHCLTLNYDKTNMLMQLWCDGAKIAEASLTTTPNKGTGIVVNAYASANTNPDGLVDVTCYYRNVTFFARTLTEAEILGLAQELTPTT